MTTGESTSTYVNSYVIDDVDMTERALKDAATIIESLPDLVQILADRVDTDPEARGLLARAEVALIGLQVALEELDLPTGSFEATES
jgi:hypothetical protein